MEQRIKFTKREQICVRTLCFEVVSLTVVITSIPNKINLKINEFYQLTIIGAHTYHIIVLSRTIMNAC